MCFRNVINSLQLYVFWSSVDPYGFERSKDFDYESYEEFMSEYLVVLTRRSIKWSKLLKGKSKVQKNVKRECENWTDQHIHRVNPHSKSELHLSFFS